LGETFINSFFGRFAVSRARSLLAYRFDMSRRSLRGSLRLIPKKQISKGFTSAATFYNALF
jgi:hypothetical protein